MKLGPIVSSFLFHLLLAGLLLFKLSPVEIQKPEVFEIEIKKPVLSQVTQKNIKKEKAAGSSRAQKNALFFPQMNAYSLLAKSEFGSAPALKEKIAFNDSRTFDTSIDEVFGEDGNKNWSYYREVYRKIDSHLIFDSILAQYSHFGRVYVQFKVSEEGLFKLEDLKTDASDSILKVHVLRAIQKSLSEPLEKVKYAKSENDTLFQAEFDFSFGEPETNFYKQKDFGKPVFVFKRATIEKPIPKELLDQLLSGGVTPNISLMYERWQKYNKKKHLEAIQFDPFEGYKRDAFYQM